VIRRQPLEVPGCRLPPDAGQAIRSAPAPPTTAKRYDAGGAASTRPRLGVGFRPEGEEDMTRRSPAMVILLSVVTCGLYIILWFVSTKDEMVRKGAQIPSAWWMIVPIGNIWWTWKWAGGVEHVTRGKTTQPVAFIAVFLLSTIGAPLMQSGLDKGSQVIALLATLLLNAIGMAIVQIQLNKAIDEEMDGQLPRARVV
jgi:hypothetical protein